MEADGSRWKQIEVDGSRWKQIEADGNTWKLMEPQLLGKKYDEIPNC
jgi:hypothetical protein